METQPLSGIAERSKYFFYIGVLFVAVLMIANTTAVKLIEIGPFIVSGAIIIFPISYIFGDVLTEVYGYRATRKIIWSAFGALILMSLCYYLVQLLPPAGFWTENQASYVAILGAAPRIAFASMIAFFAGEFANSYVLSKMKIWSAGKHLWMRTIGSTVVGEGVDTVLVVLIGFAGTVPNSALLTIILSAYVLKVAYEIIVTPITYAIVGWLKRAEGIDVYDRGINYTPFSLKD